jgi:hypothetical protein
MSARQFAHRLREPARLVARDDVNRGVPAGPRPEVAGPQQRLPTPGANETPLFRPALVDDPSAKVGQGGGLVAKRPVVEQGEIGLLNRLLGAFPIAGQAVGKPDELDAVGSEEPAQDLLSCVPCYD